MKKSLNIILLSVFSIGIVLLISVFLLIPGIKLISEANNIVVLTREDIQNKKEEIQEKYTALNEELNQKYINLNNELEQKYTEKELEIERKYIEIRSTVEAKYLLEMGDDGWFEEQKKKSEDIRLTVTIPKQSEKSALVDEKYTEEEVLRGKKINEAKNLTANKEYEISLITSNNGEKTAKHSKGMMLCVIGGLIILSIIAFIVYIFNMLTRAKNKVGEAWAQIEVQLKKRYDLIPNIVEVVKGYAKHEKKTLETIVNCRTDAIKTKDIDEEMKLNNEITNSLHKIIALKEEYPELKADKNYLSLQHKLVDIENDISESREYYNSAVMRYKNVRETFPNNMFTTMFNFKDVSYFEAPEEDRKNVKIKL